MSVYEYGDTTIYEVAVHGQMENAPPITQPMPDWWPMRDEVYDATRATVPFGAAADFYLVHRAAGTGQTSRMRWVVQAEMLGPELRWEESAGPSRLLFHLKRAMYAQDYSVDPANPMPWFGFRDLFAAVLAKQALGAGPVQIPYSGADPIALTPQDIPFSDGDPIVFTPQEIQYSRLGYDDAREPYGDPVWGWTFTGESTDPYEPALWVVPTGQQDGVKVSVCVNYNGEQWSELSEPAPAFDPLPAPPDA